MFASAGATDSMKTPESVRYDADLDAFFVSNINGNASEKDGNGFIVRVDSPSLADREPLWSLAWNPRLPPNGSMNGCFCTRSPHVRRTVA